MKTIMSFVLILFIVFSSTCQVKEQPIFSFLTSIKNDSEYSLKKIIIQQELEVAQLKDTDKQKAIFENFKNNIACFDAYNSVKSNVDKFITQLTADLTISNNRKVLKSLNKGIYLENTWSKSTIDDIWKRYLFFKSCTEKRQMAAVGLDEITGLFTALTTIYTSNRDFRAQQNKLLCEQLNGLRLKEFNELSSGSSAKKEESK